MKGITPLKYKRLKMINMNNHVFKGHKTILGSRYVTYGEVELPLRYETFAQSKDSFDWGNRGSASLQLAFSILFQLSDEEFAAQNAVKFTDEVICSFKTRDWILNASDVNSWIKENTPLKEIKAPIMRRVTPHRKATKEKTNVVKEICKELNITQKNLAQILEIPEGTVSSWAVKNEIPRLGKKAKEFYIESVKNQKIVDSYKNFVDLLKAS